MVSVKATKRPRHPKHRRYQQKALGLVKKGWEEISHPAQKKSGHHTYREPSTGLRIRFDKAEAGRNGFAGKNHYHILNPNATGLRDMYLDKNGNPVKKNSRASHILPKGDD